MTNPPKRLPRRLLQLYLGLALYGLSMALMIRATLGVMPWDVLHQGLAHHTRLSYGTVTMLVGGAVLLSWIPLRQQPGIGTVSNVIAIGLAVDASLVLVPEAHALPSRVSMAAAGIVLNGVATAAYVGACFGPGPRDGLMTGLVRRTGASVRLVRTSIEVTVVAAGWMLGGTLGVVTVAYALAIGPIVHVLLPRLAVDLDTPAPGTLLRLADNARTNPYRKDRKMHLPRKWVRLNRGRDSNPRPSGMRSRCDPPCDSCEGRPQSPAPASH